MPHDKLGSLGPGRALVEASVDEFTVVFKCLEADVNRFKAEPMLYRLEVEEVFLPQLVKKLRLERMGGLVESSSLASYSEGLVTDDGAGSVRVSFSPNRPDMGVAVKFGGAGLKTYLAVQNLRTPELLELLYDFKPEPSWFARCTKIDLAIDFLNWGMTVEDLNTSIIAEKVEIRRPIWMDDEGNSCPGRLAFRPASFSSVSNTGVVRTAYYGHRSSSFLRVYDKKVEQMNHANPTSYQKASECQDWVRFEAVFRNDSGGVDLADMFARDIASNKDQATYPGQLLGLFSSRYNFYMKGAGYTEWWEKALEPSVVKDVLTFKKDEDSWKDLEKSKNYFARGDSGLLTLLSKISHDSTSRGLDGDKAVQEYLSEIYGHFKSVDYKPSSTFEAWKKQYNTNKKKSKS